jgi:hypothetical protein
MNTRIGTHYELLATELLQQLQKSPLLSACTIHNGATNRIRGQSGYFHQIDVSVEDGSRLFLMELKCYKKAVGVEQLLVLAARKQDIQAANPTKTVYASLVSKKNPSKNVPGLAGHFDVGVHVVESLHSYALSFANDHFVGLHETAHASDSISAVKA